MISSRNLNDLSAPDRLEALCQSLAMLDAVLSPEWEYRYFSFNSRWREEPCQRMATMRNGSGDHFFAAFSKDGAIIKGFDHEAPMSPWAGRPIAVWAGVLNEVPDRFSGYFSEPAFPMLETTFCIWHGADDGKWTRGQIDYPPGDDPDGSAHLLWILDGDPATYLKFADEYHGCKLALDDVVAIYALSPLSREFVDRLNPEASWSEILSEAEKIGYPLLSREAS